MCTCVHTPLPNTVYPAGLVHLIKKSSHLCHVIWCSFSPMRFCYYQRIEVTLLQNIFSLFVRDNFFLDLNVNFNSLHVNVSALENFFFSLLNSWVWPKMFCYHVFQCSTEAKWLLFFLAYGFYMPFFPCVSVGKNKQNPEKIVFLALEKVFKTFYLFRCFTLSG